MSAVVWLLGLSGAGKTTLARRLLARAQEKGAPADLVDGDLVREFFGDTSGYGRENRVANIKRIVFASSLLSRNGILTIVSNISPYEETRAFAREKIPGYLEIYLKASVEDCARRDPKGLYKKARAGENKNMIGIDEPFEEPRTPDLVVDTVGQTEDECLRRILAFLAEKKVL